SGLVGPWRRGGLGVPAGAGCRRSGCWALWASRRALDQWRRALSVEVGSAGLTARQRSAARAHSMKSSRRLASGTLVISARTVLATTDVVGRTDFLRDRVRRYLHFFRWGPGPAAIAAGLSLCAGIGVVGKGYTHAPAHLGIRWVHGCLILLSELKIS